MTRDDIIRMARKAGYSGYDSQSERLHEFAALVAAHEREACAELCDEVADDLIEALQREGGDEDFCLNAVASARVCSHELRHIGEK